MGRGRKELYNIQDLFPGNFKTILELPLGQILHVKLLANLSVYFSTGCKEPSTGSFVFT